MRAPTDGPALILIGPPGAGKTTVGRELARRLGVAFRDTDADVERAAGRSVAEIFVEDGEAAFREAERQAVAVAVGEHDGVLALGGGSVMDPQTRERIAGHRVVFLDVGFAEAFTRTGLNQARPLLAVNPRATLRRMLEERRPVYQALATITVTTDGRSVEEIVDEVLAAVGSRQ